MELRRNKFIYVVASIFALLMVAFTLAACGSKKETYEVTFNVQDDSSVWNVYKTVTVDNGTVEMPADPAKEYYTFSGWYLDQNLTGDQFKNENLGSNINVYAKFVAVQVNVYINGQSEGEKDLVTVVKGSYNPGEGLTFDGWYTDSNYTVKWNGTDVTQNLYAKSVATITFNNGYEDVYETYVNPNTVYESPKTQKITVTTKDSDGNETSKEGTVESLKITKSYMATRDISYVDENGDAFDFTKAITKNTTVTVNWRSPLLIYTKNEETGNLCVRQYGGKEYLDASESKYVDDNGKTKRKTLTSFPIISILSKITYDLDEDGVDEEYTVDSVTLERSGFLGSANGSAIKKLVIGEGIKSIQNINGDSPTTLENVSLPSTLKVIQNCFNNCNNLTGINIPDGVEVIIGSFFANTSASYNGWSQYNKGENYSFDITIPESVINLSMVPSNLKFSHTKTNAEDKDFYRDGDYLYQKDGNNLVLVGDYTTSDVVSVPEGVNGIQVGTYFNRTIKELYLPSTFSYVKYNESADNYPYVKLQYSSNTALFVEEYLSDPVSTSAYNSHSDKMPAIAYSIFNMLESTDVLCFYSASAPENFSKYSILGDSTGFTAISESKYEPYTAASFTNKVVFVGESDNPVVTIDYRNNTNGYGTKLTINKTKNSTLTYDEIFAALDTATTKDMSALYTNGSLIVDSLTSFNNTYDLSTAITTNAYLVLNVSYKSVSTTYPVSVEKTTGGAKVTGLNESGAILDENGKYVVIIPSSVVISGETLSVVEIAEGAFKGNTTIETIVLPSSVKTIAKEAFMNAANLTVIDLSSVKLETIGDSAFEGCAVTSLTLALSDLKSVGKYAFKSESLIYFEAVEDEKNRSITTKDDLTTGDFFFSYETVIASYKSQYTYASGLYQYKSKTTSSDEKSTTIYNVDFVASTNARSKNMYYFSQSIELGEINTDKNYVIEYNVLEGSLYFLEDYDNLTIEINAVSKFETKAFTDIAVIEYSLYISYSSYFYEKNVASYEALKEAKGTQVFADGWVEDATAQDFEKIFVSKL